MAERGGRRQHGTGTITVDAQGRYVGRFYHGYTRSGNPRRVAVYHRPEPGEHEKTSVAAVKRLMAERRRQIDSGAPAVQQRLTVKGYAERWLDRRAEEVRPGTWRTDRSLVLAHVVPTIGHRRLDHITSDDVRSVVTAARAAGVADTSCVRLFATLRKMLRDAATDGYQIKPAVHMVKPPAAGESDRDAIPTPDALAILDAALRRPDASRWVAALLQGMRQGEALGLTWECVDLDRGLIDVSWQLKALPYRHGCTATGRPTCGRRFGGDCPQRRIQSKPGDEARPLDGALHLVRPKTRSGRRIIPLVPWMEGSLRRWREVAPASPHGLVWPRADGRPGLDSEDNAAWYEIQDAAHVWHSSGRRYTIHEARHTTATLLLEAGVSEAVIIAIMGHSSIVTSRGYMHVSQTLARRALEDVARRLELPRIAQIEP